MGYNGFARVLGKGSNVFQMNPVVGAAAGTPFEVNQGHHGGFSGFGGNTQGLARLFTGEFGFEIGWLLPAALLALVLVFVSRGRAPRTDVVRAGAIVFGVWMLVDGLVLSYMKTMVHPYYCLSFVPAVCGMVAIGVHEMWGRRDSWLGRGGLAAMVLGTGGWSWWILGRNAEWFPTLRWLILAVTVLSACCLAWSATTRVAATVRRGRAGGRAGRRGSRCGRLFLRDARSAPQRGHGHGRPRPSRTDTAGTGARTTTTRSWRPCFGPPTPTFSAAINRSSAAAGLELSTKTAVMAIGGFGGSDPAPTLGEFEQDVANHRIGYYVAPSQEHRPGGFGSRSAHTDITTWVAAHFTPTAVGADTVYDLTAPAK